MSKCEHCGKTPASFSGWGTYGDEGEHIPLKLCEECTSDLDEIARIVKKKDALPSIKSDKETTQFTCGVCGEKWNLVSPKSDIDTCPECGITVYSDSLRSTGGKP